MSFINRVRLPIKITRPQLLEDRVTFRKANGVTKTLSVVIRKQYEGSTDFMPEKLHDRLKIALAHDNVEIEGEKYVGGVVAEPEYSIDWPDFLDYPLGRGNFKVNVNPFDATNSNCATCEDLAQVVTEDDDIGSVGEGDELNVPILDNDTICCSPFEISIITFNSDYVDSGSVVDNELILQLKTPLVTQNNVILATYRVTCDNGQYDEANVIADVSGSITACLSPLDVIADVGAAGIDTATISWTAPSPAADSYSWELFEADDLVTPVQGGFTPDLSVVLEDLVPDTDYVFKIRGVCGEESSNVAQVEFNNPFVETSNCGNYVLEFDDGTGDPHVGTGITYLACDGEYHTVFVRNTFPKSICCEEITAGTPTYIESSVNVTSNYDPGNPRECGTVNYV